jgi:hypothetical protein
MFTGYADAALEMPEIRALARAHSSSLKAREMEEKALQKDLEFKGKWANPQLLGQIGSVRSGETRGSTLELSLTQAVPITNKFALRRELAERALENQGIQKDRFQNWVEHQALLSAWRVRIRYELHSHGIERAGRICLIERHLATQPRASIRQRVERSIFSSMVLQLQRQQDQKKLDLAQAEEELSYWIGQKVSASEIRGTIPAEGKVRLPPEGSYRKDPEWLEANHRLESARIEAKVASRERWPDLLVGGGYRVERVVPSNQFTYGLIGLTLPLWDGGFSRHDSAEARFQKSELELEEVGRRIRLKHEQQLAQARFDLQQIQRFPITLVREQERAIREAEEGFKQRLVDVNTFVQAETQTHEVLDQIFLSWQAYLESLSSLQLLNGEPLEWEAP